MLESVPRQAKVVSRVQDQVNFSNWKKVMWYCILHKLDILHSMFSSLPFWLGHEYGISLKPSVEFMTSKFAKCRNKRTLCRMACYCAIGWCDIASGQLFSDCIHMVHPIGCSFTVAPETLAFWHGLVFRHSTDCISIFSAIWSHVLFLGSGQPISWAAPLENHHQLVIYNEDQHEVVPSELPEPAKPWSLPPAPAA